jgi:hypothetical protein
MIPAMGRRVIVRDDAVVCSPNFPGENRCTFGQKVASIYWLD